MSISQPATGFNPANAENWPIETFDLGHFYGIGEARKQVLFDINLKIRRGSLTILMGASGSGKTTLLTLIGCLRAVETGNARLLGQMLNGADEKTLILARRELGFIFQAHNLHESLTAIENVQMGLAVHGRNALANWQRDCSHMLKLMKLDERQDYLPQQLSGGQKQRVAIARALIANPQIIFADEPTAALDAKTGREIVELLKRLGQQRFTTTLMVTHDNRILDLADRIITMEDGRIVKDEHRE